MKQTTFFAALGLALAAVPASAQDVKLDTHALGYGTDVWFSRTYDTGSVMTFLAKVEQVIETGPTSNDGAVAVSYVVRPYTRQDIGNGKVRDIFQAPITVEVGPAWFVHDQSTKVKAGDYVGVTGSLVSHEDGGVIVAEMIRRNKAVLGLRRPSGEPFWMVNIDANNAASGGTTASANTAPPSNAVTYFKPDIFPPVSMGWGPNNNVQTYGSPAARVGNVFIYDNPWYSPYPTWMSPYYWPNYSLGPMW
jgi:hypothetical protein